MKKIALIEDDEPLLQMYKDALVRGGFDVVSANDGQEGFVLINKEKPDLILLDLMMPRMNGFEVMKKMKNDPEINQIPIIILTNYPEVNNVARAVQLGAKEYRLKTDFTPDQIVEKVKKILENK